MSLPPYSPSRVADSDEPRASLGYDRVIFAARGQRSDVERVEKLRPRFRKLAVEQRRRRVGRRTIYGATIDVTSYDGDRDGLDRLAAMHGLMATAQSGEIALVVAETTTIKLAWWQAHVGKKHHGGAVFPYFGDDGSVTYYFEPRKASVAMKLYRGVRKSRHGDEPGQVRLEWTVSEKAITSHLKSRISRQGRSPRAIAAADLTGFAREQLRLEEVDWTALTKVLIRSGRISEEESGEAWAKQRADDEVALRVDAIEAQADEVDEMMDEFSTDATAWEWKKKAKERTHLRDFAAKLSGELGRATAAALQRSPAQLRSWLREIRPRLPERDFAAIFRSLDLYELKEALGAEMAGLLGFEAVADNHLLASAPAQRSDGCKIVTL